jgi:ferredoxin
VTSDTEARQMRVSIDEGNCQGHQSCAIVAPEVFGADDLGNGIVLIDGDIPEALQQRVRRAERNCPERAITISE